MTLIIIATLMSLLWWIAVGIYRNTGWSDGCAHTTAWGTVPLWSLYLGGIGTLLGLTIAVIETATGRKFKETFGVSLAVSSLAGLVAAMIGYNLPRVFLNYASCGTNLQEAKT